MNILISGSLAYDRIMDFPGKFSDHILPEKIHVLNVAFTVNSLTEKFGGTAGNIAYSLSLLGEKPIILSTIGRDYHRYYEWLEENNITREGIKIINDELTACAYITTDQSDNQITGFNPGAMKYRVTFDLDEFNPDNTIAIVAPGNLDDMVHLCQEYKSKGIRYIFDPGQQLTSFDKESILKCIDGAYILISNDYELEMIMEKIGLDRDGILKLVTIIITTLGENGSRVCTIDRVAEIPPVKIEKAVDPTGAGDSYRSGLIKGLVQNLDIVDCAAMGSACASFAVEYLGTQEHRFTHEEFQKRLESIK
ncbi:MAG: carbohydrate kinase family protein [Dehalococcoidales bacterium]|nr:MAG: carbohydrate kinase family protein [Dehalococcoidales bacterium]